MQTTISNLTKMAQSYSKWVENTVGKGEIARYEQFLLFPQCFQKACFPGVSKGVIVWEWVKDRFGLLSDRDRNWFFVVFSRNAYFKVIQF